MRVLIMTAGESKRLRPLTEQKPKTLIPLDDKEILHHILDICRSQGLIDFCLLTGHGAEHVKIFGEKYKADHPEVKINYIYNDQYNTKGNIYSMYCGQELFADDFILINSDTIFHPDILKFLIEHPEKNVMALDDYKDLSEEEMKIRLDEEGKIKKIHKKLDPQNSQGEYIGVMKMGGQYKNELLKSLEEVMAQDDSLYYEDGLQHLMDQGVPFYPSSTKGLPGIEIDTHEDLAEAKEMIKKITSPSTSLSTSGEGEQAPLSGSACLPARQGEGPGERK